MPKLKKIPPTAQWNFWGVDKIFEIEYEKQLKTNREIKIIKYARGITLAIPSKS